MHFHSLYLVVVEGRVVGEIEYTAEILFAWDGWTVESILMDELTGDVRLPRRQFVLPAHSDLHAQLIKQVRDDNASAIEAEWRRWRRVAREEAQADQARDMGDGR